MMPKIILDEKTNKILDQVLFQPRIANFSRMYALQRNPMASKAREDNGTVEKYNELFQESVLFIKIGTYVDRCIGLIIVN